MSALLGLLLFGWESCFVVLWRGTAFSILLAAMYIDDDHLYDCLYLDIEGTMSTPFIYHRRLCRMFKNKEERAR